MHLKQYLFQGLENSIAQDEIRIDSNEADIRWNFFVCDCENNILK